MHQQRASRRTKTSTQINVCAPKNHVTCVGFGGTCFFPQGALSLRRTTKATRGVDLNHSLHSTVTLNNLTTNEVIQHRRRSRPRHGHRQERRSPLASPQGHGVLCKDHLQGRPRCSGCNNNWRVNTSEESECLYYGQKDLGVDPQEVPTPH